MWDSLIKIFWLFLLAGFLVVLAIRSDALRKVLPNKVVNAIYWGIDIFNKTFGYFLSTLWLAVLAIIIVVVIATIWTVVTGSPLEF